MTHDTGAGYGDRTPSSSTYGSDTAGASTYTAADPTTPIATQSSGSTDSGSSTTEVAKDQARDVAGTAKEAGAQVAGTAKDQAKEVAAEARTQARDLMREGRTQVRDQARQGQRAAADTLTTLSEELRQMADTGQSGLATDVARQAADKAHDVALWLQKREPGDLLEEARNWARRNPGTFLIGAALAGLAVGRLTRGLVDDKRDAGFNSGGGTIGSGTRQGDYDPAYGAGNTAYDSDLYRTSGYAAAVPAPTATPTTAVGGTTGYDARGADYDPAYPSSGYSTGTAGAAGGAAADFGGGQTAPGMGSPGAVPAYEPPPGTMGSGDPDERGYGTGGGTTGRTTS